MHNIRWRLYDSVSRHANTDGLKDLARLVWQRIGNRESAEAKLVDAAVADY